MEKLIRLADVFMKLAQEYVASADLKLSAEQLAAKYSEDALRNTREKLPSGPSFESARTKLSAAMAVRRRSGGGSGSSKAAPMSTSIDFNLYAAGPIRNAKLGVALASQINTLYANAAPKPNGNLKAFSFSVKASKKGETWSAVITIDWEDKSMLDDTSNKTVSAIIQAIKIFETRTSQYLSKYLTTALKSTLDPSVTTLAGSAYFNSGGSMPLVSLP